MVGILTLLQIGVVLFLGYVELEWTLVLIAVALASNPGLA